MSAKFDALTERQKEAALMIVQSAIANKTTGAKKLKQKEIAEEIGVTSRTIRNWEHDELFLEYVGYLSRIKLQSAMPDFVGVLMANLEKGQNVSTKQLDLIAKVADWIPDKQSEQQSSTLSLSGSNTIEDRIRQLEERKRAEVVGIQEKAPEEAEEAMYRESD